MTSSTAAPASPPRPPPIWTALCPQASTSRGCSRSCTRRWRRLSPATRLRYWLRQGCARPCDLANLLLQYCSIMACLCSDQSMCPMALLLLIPKDHPLTTTRWVCPW
uniref:Uncharacterized protein n=1 Tax=Arundo donax TaxID=35708 RepID=A0A0A9HGB2_ARUDO